MLKKLKSFFSKKKNNKPEQKIYSSITLMKKEDGNTYLDVYMLDFSDKSIESCADLIATYNPVHTIEVLAVVKSQLQEYGREDIYNKILEVLAGIVSNANIEEKFEEDPCINPSDVL
jgi:hypothetical protein